MFTNVEQDTIKNINYRNVLWTGKRMQYVVMSLLPGEEIGWEVHPGDQFIRVEEGQCMVFLDDEPPVLLQSKRDMDAVFIPLGTEHNVVNTGTKKCKLYTLYAPPQHSRFEKERFK